MDEPPKKPSLIDKSLKTEMDRRMAKVREYLMTIEELTPLADLEYRQLIKKMTEKPNDK
jgi:hypothetical protein